MMKLYDIDKSISDCVDAETGEVIDLSLIHISGGIVQYTAAPCFTGFLRVIRVNSKK